MTYNLKRIYLDTNLFNHWFELSCSHRRQKADEEKIIRFLAEHKEIEKFISTFSIAEVVANLRREFQSKIQLKDISDLIRIFQEITGTQIIKIDIFKDAKGFDRKGILLTERIAEYAFYCMDAKDAIHIDIAQTNDLLLVTRDTDISRIKSVYPSIIGESKYRKQF